MPALVWASRGLRGSEAFGSKGMATAGGGVIKKRRWWLGAKSPVMDV